MTMLSNNDPRVAMLLSENKGWHQPVKPTLDKTWIHKLLIRVQCIHDKTRVPTYIKGKLLHQQNNGDRSNLKFKDYTIFLWFYLNLLYLFQKNILQFIFMEFLLIELWQPCRLAYLIKIDFNRYLTIIVRFIQGHYFTQGRNYRVNLNNIRL